MSGARVWQQAVASGGGGPALSVSLSPPGGGERGPRWCDRRRSLARVVSRQHCAGVGG